MAWDASEIVATVASTSAIAEMARTASEMGVQPTMVTNGWLLPGQLESLRGTGISTIFISIDSEDAGEHEKNRGLKGVCERIQESTVARVTVSAGTIVAIAAIAGAGWKWN